MSLISNEMETRSMHPVEEGERQSSHLLVVFGLAFVLVSALIVRLYYFSQHSVYTTDSYYFLLLARSIRGGAGYTVRGFAHYKYFPGYPLLIAFLSIFLRNYEWTAGIIAAVSGVISVLFSYLIGKELFSEVAGLLGASILAFHPVFMQFTASPMTEGLFTALFCAGLYLLITGCRGGSSFRRVLGFALAGLSLATRVEGILFIPLALLVIFLYWKENRPKPWEIPLMLFVYSLPLGLYLLRNILRAGRLSAYTQEYEKTKAINLRLMVERTRLLAWNTLYDKLLFYLGSLVALLRRWKAFLILFGWFFLFVVFHVFWYYTHPRFLAPALPAVCILAGYFLYEACSICLRAINHIWERAKGFAGIQASGKGIVSGAQVDKAALVCKSSSESVDGKRGKGLKLARGCIIAFFALLFCLVIFQNVRNAEHEVRWQINTMAGDMGGRAIKHAVDFFKQNGGCSQVIATTVGPYFAWEYKGPVLYTKDVPVAIPFEKADVKPPDLIRKLAERKVRYFLITNISGGKKDLIFPGVPEDARKELAQAGVRQSEVKRLRLVKYWNEYYRGRKPPRVFVAIFEILPEQSRSAKN